MNERMNEWMNEFQRRNEEDIKMETSLGAVEYQKEMDEWMNYWMNEQMIECSSNIGVKEI